VIVGHACVFLMHRINNSSSEGMKGSVRQGDVKAASDSLSQPQILYRWGILRSTQRIVSYDRQPGIRLSHNYHFLLSLYYTYYIVKVLRSSKNRFLDFVFPMIP